MPPFAPVTLYQKSTEIFICSLYYLTLLAAPTSFSSSTSLLLSLTEVIETFPLPLSFQDTMGVDHAERVGHLRALYEKGREQGGEFSEWIKQCERSLVEHGGMPPFWRIKTYCLLVGSYQHDWHEAEVSPRDSRTRKA